MGKIRLALAAAVVAAMTITGPAGATHMCAEGFEGVCDTQHVLVNKVDGLIGTIFCKYSSSC